MSAFAQNVIPTDETIFIVGNGPSLKGFDLQLLAGFSWVGMNAAYRHWHEIKVYPTYYACLDLIVGLSHAEEIQDLVENADRYGIIKFLLRDNLIIKHPKLATSPLVVNFDEAFGDVPNRVLNLITTGSHSALWVASLGYKQIMLLGIDANYQDVLPGRKKLKDNKLVIQNPTKNPNYYFDHYQKVGDAYTVPNPVPEVHIGAWRRVSQYLSHIHSNEVIICNGSRRSLIDVAPFFDLKNFFSGQSELVKAWRHFEDNEFQLHRSFSREEPVRLEDFINMLTPPRVNKASLRVGSNPAFSVQTFRRNGWKIINAEQNKAAQSLIYLERSEDVQLAKNAMHAEVTVSGPHNKYDLIDVLEWLNQSNDTVLLLEERKGFSVKKYPCRINESNCYALAYKTSRFWNSEIETALDKATYSNAFIARFLRTLMRWIYRIKQALKF